ncbi:MAG: hypothetical protein IBX55_01865 [Methyloprofundus sp.]|nr:hypothetical protein [Methyloprofundus sp.]
MSKLKALPNDWDLIRESDESKIKPVKSDFPDRSEQEFQSAIGVMAGVLVASITVGVLFFGYEVSSFGASIIYLILAIIFWVLHGATVDQNFTLDQGGGNPVFDMNDSGPTRAGTSEAGTSLYPTGSLSD